jgi:GPH family glycoside/pentoside/hexuronide:cation symporter
LKPIRLILFSSADFGFNLYWQSLTFFLFYFYTDVLGLPPGAAGALLLVGALWDGIAALAVGVWLQRVLRYASLLRFGALPLGAAFVALYVALPLRGTAFLVSATLIHFLFRTLYVATNIPYSALTARITADSRDRGRIAALRMAFGAAAAVFAALATGQLAYDLAAGYGLTAALFAVIATALIVGVGATVHESVTPDMSDAAKSQPFRALTSLASNRAFVSLALAAAAAMLAGSAVSGSVMFYFADVVRSPVEGPVTIAWMTGAGAASLALWTFLRDRFGTRALWLVLCLLAVAACVAFATIGGSGIWPARLFLIVMQVALTGFSFAFWAMLPDTVEWGEWRTGCRIEGPVFGSAILIQRIATGSGSALLGVLLGGAQGGHDVAGVRMAMVVLPGIAIALSALLMLANPLRRHTHDAIVAALGRGV